MAEATRNSDTYDWCKVLTILFVWTVALFNVNDSGILTTTILLACSCICTSITPSRWNGMDWAVATFLIYEVCSAAISLNLHPALSMCHMSANAFLVYHIQKDILSSTSLGPRKVQGTATNIMSLTALAIALVSFGIFAKGAHEAGFYNLVDFRHLYRPLGYSTNVWSEILLMIFGMTLCIGKDCKCHGITVFMALLLLVLSFSRSAYISAILLLFAYLAIIQERKDKAIMMAGLMVAITSGLLFFCNEVCSTLNVMGAEVQRRSVVGRMEAMNGIWDVFNQHWLVGYGAGNYTLAMDSFYGQDSTKMYTSYAPNIIVKILIERGLLGIAAVSALIAIAAIQALKKRKDKATILASVTLLAVILKEMSLATLSSTDIGWTATAILLAVIGTSWNMSKGNGGTRSAKKWYIITMCLLCCCMEPLYKVLCPQKHFSTLDIQAEYMNALKELENNRNSIYKLREIVCKYPLNAQYRYSLYKEELRLGNKEKAVSQLEQAIELMPRIMTIKEVRLFLDSDSAQFAEIRQWLAAKYMQKSNNPLCNARHGMIAYLCGDKAKAERNVDNAIKTLPNLPMPWLLKGLLSQERGNSADAKSCFKKYEWLTSGTANVKKKKYAIPELTEESLGGTYALKHINWYGTEYDDNKH